MNRQPSDPDDEWVRRRLAHLAFRRSPDAWSNTGGQTIGSRPASFVHGRRYAYEKMGCRCDECRQWAADAWQRRKSRSQRGVAA